MTIEINIPLEKMEKVRLAGQHFRRLRLECFQIRLDKLSHFGELTSSNNIIRAQTIDADKISHLHTNIKLLDAQLERFNDLIEACNAIRNLYFDSTYYDAVPKLRDTWEKTIEVILDNENKTIDQVSQDDAFVIMVWRDYRKMIMERPLYTFPELREVPGVATNEQ